MAKTASSFLKCKVRVLVRRALLVAATYLLVVHKLVRRADFLVSIDGAGPEEAWNVLADFSNYAALNPHLIEFKLLDEKHDKSKMTQRRPWRVFWNYTVSYSEHFENLPEVLTNSAVGDYSVYSDAGDSYVIESEHVTCLLPGWCLRTTAKDVFRSPGGSGGTKGKGCELSETIQYECPVILLPLCSSEVKKQRTTVLENLANWNYEVAR